MPAGGANSRDGSRLWHRLPVCPVQGVPVPGGVPPGAAGPLTELPGALTLQGAGE
jgi:hypothetical protein